MATLNESWEDLGRRVRTTSDRDADVEATLQAARARFLATARVDRSRLSRHLPALLAAALCAAALLFVGVQALRSGSVPWGSRPLTFTVGEEARPGALGAWVRPEANALALHFSDGSLVTLSPAARARVAATTRDGAEVLLEQGSLQAAITHQAKQTAWLVRGGPYSVRVTGTSFSLAWDPATERLELTLHEGSVTVSGPHLPEGRAVVAGEILVVESRTGVMRLTRAGASASLSPRDAAPAPSTRAPSAAASASASAPAVNDAPADQNVSEPTPAAPPETPAWRASLARGDTKAALAEVERGGGVGVLHSATAAELWQLADAARLGGRPTLAAAALQALRQRHGTRGSTAFLLGKISADQQGAPAAAVRWFETYLREAPSGPLAEEALGRLMLLERRSNPANARGTAKRYLARYPSGAYSELARSLAAP